MKTFKELCDDPMGTVYVDRIEDGIRFLILRGSASLCAYVSTTEKNLKLVKVNHALAGNHSIADNLSCHGGITLEGSLVGHSGFWYGWDYAHSGDAFMFEKLTRDRTGVEWTVEMVERDCKDTIKQFRELIGA